MILDPVESRSVRGGVRAGTAAGRQIGPLLCAPILLFPVLFLGGCLTPPAILKASTLPLAQALALYPSETVVAQIPKPDGSSLTGFHVLAGPDAPLVLNLSDSSGSPAGAGSDFGVLAGQLRELGFASLFIDYEGVGLSAGERSITNLPADAWAAWNAALALVGGDPSRVIVRGISIGTVAAAELLEAGARPRAMLWIAPVRPATVVPRFARKFHGFWAWLAASLLYGPAGRPEPHEAIAASKVPVHVLGSKTDALLSPEENEELARAAQANGGTWSEAGADHVMMSIRARRLSPEELAILRPLAAPPTGRDPALLLDLLPPGFAPQFAEGSAARDRLEHLTATQSGAAPVDVLAAALANDDWVDSWRMLWLHRIRPFAVETFEDRVAAFSLRAPWGKLAPELVEYMSSPHDQAWRYDQVGPTLDPRAVAELARLRPASYRVRYQLACGLKYEVSFDLNMCWVGSLLASHDLDAATVAVARYLLKSSRIPDRLVAEPAGPLQLEALWEGRWESLAALLATTTEEEALPLTGQNWK